MTKVLKTCSLNHLGPVLVGGLLLSNSGALNCVTPLALGNASVNARPSIESITKVCI